MKKVSIIIPIYNVEKFLGRCLDSLIRQTYKNFEIICVNDASPDNCQFILDKYEKQYGDLIKVLVNEKNLGLGRTRDRAIEYANGEYVMFIDSDDYVKEDYIETYINSIQNNEDIIIGGYIRDSLGKLKFNYCKDSIWSTITYTIACAKMYKKSFIVDNNLKFLEYKCGEDIFFNLNVFFSKPVYRVINYCGYYYYYNSNSITGAMNHDKNFENMICEMYDDVLKLNNFDLLSDYDQDIIEYTFITHMINALFTYNRGCGRTRMLQKYNFCLMNLESKFPEYKNNRFIGLKNSKGQTFKVRFAVFFSSVLYILHLDKLFWGMIGILPF